MKIRQNIRHWAAKKALTTPVVGDALDGPELAERVVDRDPVSREELLVAPVMLL